MIMPVTQLKKHYQCLREQRLLLWCLNGEWQGRALLRSVVGQLNRTVSTLAASRTLRESIMMAFATCYCFQFIVFAASVTGSKIFLEKSTFNT